MNKIAPYWKAVVGFIAPGAVTLGGAVTAGSDGGTAITGAEWVIAVVACIVTGAAVYGVPNLDPAARHQDESVQPPTERTTTRRIDTGAVSAVEVALIALVIVVVLVVVGVI